MAAEPSSRYTHLLQPIRDLSKVWKIEIAEELERYLEEVDQLLVDNPEAGVSQLNFAEAALLIQGSTAIYSRKVELLHQLVYQALDLLSVDKKDASRRGRTAQAGLLGPLPDTDELHTIGHLIKEGRNILLDHSAPEQRQAGQRRAPLFLLPRDPADRRERDEFRIGSCAVHHSGLYLLQESDARLLDDDAAGDEEAAAGADAPLLPAPPREVQDLDDRLQELLRGDASKAPPQEVELPPLGEMPAAPMSPAPRGMEEEFSGLTPTKLATPLGQRGLVLAGADAAKRGALVAQHDPWAALDEHDAVGQELPLEVGKTSRRPQGAKYLTGASPATEDEDTAFLGDDELWDASFGDQAVTRLLAAGHPVESLFLAAASRSKAGGRFEAQRSGFSAAWLEFEDLFCRAATRRRCNKAFAKRPEAPGTPHASDDEGGGELVAPLVPPELSMTPVHLAPMRGGEDLGLPPLPDITSDQLVLDERREEVARLETMIEDAQSQYEATIRQHLHATNKDASETSDARFAELYSNVRRWQEQLAPRLKEFESRPEFDMDVYSGAVLGKMALVPNSSAEEAVEGEDVAAEDGQPRCMKFSRLVHGQPRWEICRRFLTCLILTNTGNTDIVFDTEDDRINGFSVQLLEAERRPVSLEDRKAVATPARGRKSRAPAALQDAAPARKKKRSA